MIERTPEQVAADNALDDAIRAACKAYGAEELIGAWTVVVALVDADDPGLEPTMILEPNGHQPAWAAIGLLRTGLEDLLNNRRVTE